MDLSGIIILTNKNINNNKIVEFKDYYLNNKKHIRSLVYTTQEYCSYNDISLSSIDKNIFVNDPIFRKNNKNNIIDNSFSIFYYINTNDKLDDVSFQEHIYDNSDNILSEITSIWNNTISYEFIDISNIYYKYNKSITEFVNKPPWSGVPSYNQQDLSWNLINVSLNTGHSINESIYDICSNLSALRACVLINNIQDVNIIKSSRVDWDSSVYKILPQDVKHFYAPHITQYNEKREIHRNIYWADISGMDLPLGNIQDISSCIPIWVQFQENTGSSYSNSITNEIQYYSINYFKPNRWYLLSLLSQSDNTIRENVQKYMSSLYPYKIYIPGNSEYDNNSYINITNFDENINQYMDNYNSNVVKNKYTNNSIPAWVFIGNNREPLPSLNKISIYKQQTEILLALPSIDNLESGYYYYGGYKYSKYINIRNTIIDSNLDTYLNLDNTPEFGIGNLFSIEFTEPLNDSVNILNFSDNIILSNDKRYIYIVNDLTKNSLLPDQLLYNASSDNQQKEYIILNNMPDNLPDISNVYINLEDSSGNILLYDAKNIYNNGGNIIDICNLDINTYGV